MKISKLSVFLCFFSLWVIACSCSSPIEPEPKADQNFYSYTVKLPSLHPDSFSMVMKINDFPGFDGQLILPGHYYDNPLDSFSATTAEDIVITDSLGNNVQDTLMFTQNIGPLQSTIISLPSTAKFPITVRYRVDASVIHRQEEFMPTFRFDNDALFLMGAHFFIIPLISEDLAVLWRSHQKIQVKTQIGSGVQSFGLPEQSSYRNLYELLFIQITAGGDLLWSGGSNNQHYFVVDILDDNADKSYLNYVDTIARQLIGLSDHIQGIFGNLRTQGDAYTVVFSDMNGGLEGYNGFTMIAPYEGFIPILSSLIAHEIVHHYIGIRCGDLDDPWWKEGVTTYLGYLFAARLGYYSNWDCRYHLLEHKRDYSDSKYAVTFSDPQLRENLFPSGAWPIVYERGSRISLIMDYRVRNATANGVKFEDIMAQLVRDNDGSGFSRGQFIDAFENHGVDVSDLFELYVDRVSTEISDSDIHLAFEYLESLGEMGHNQSIIASDTPLSKPRSSYEHFLKW